MRASRCSETIQGGGGSVKAHAALARDFVEKLPDARRVARRIQREEIRVRETQRQRRPDACQRRVTTEARIREPRYPLVGVKRGVVNTVRPLKSHVDNRNTDEVEKDGVVGARADTRVDCRVRYPRRLRDQVG